MLVMLRYSTTKNFYLVPGKHHRWQRRSGVNNSEG